MTVRLSAGLFERERELEQLDAALAAVLAGEGQVVVVQGSPGIGKSRLVDALCARAHSSALVLRGRGGELERELPLAVVRELFEPVVGRADDAERSRLLAGAAGLAGPLLGVGPAESGAVDSAFAVMHGLYWLTANLADGGPLVLAVDDAHWTDEATQRWLAYLVPRIAELPVLLALGLRPRELDLASPLAGALAGAPTETVDPRPFALEGTTSVVREVLGEADAAFCAAVHRATGGNPLLVRTEVGALFATGVEPTADQVDQVHAVGIDRIGRIVLPRIHRLGRSVVEFARAAAVLGEGALPGHARALAGLDESAAHAAMDALVVAEVLRPDGSLGFVHPLVRAAVTDELPRGARAGLHRRAAEVLHTAGAGAEDIARHLLACEPIGEDWALQALWKAGRRAVAHGAPEAAVQFLERALAETSVGDQRAELLFDLGRAAYQSKHPSALAWQEDALRHAEDPDLWMRAYEKVCGTYVYSGIDPPVELLATAPSLRYEHFLFLAAGATGEYGTLSPSAKAKMPPPFVPEETPAGENYFEVSWLAGAALEAVMGCDTAARAAELARAALAKPALLFEGGDGWQFTYASFALLFADELREGLAEFARGLDHATRTGWGVAFEWITAGVAASHLAMGGLADAEAYIVAVLGPESTTWTLGVPCKVSIYVDALREGGRLHEAQAVLAERGLLHDDPPPNLFGAMLLESRGRLRLAQGKVEQALFDLRLCGEVLAGFGKPHSAMYGWRAGAAECLAALGERDEARRLAAEQLADARRFGAAPWLGSSLRTLGKVTRGEEGIAHLREAVDVLAASEARLVYAHALCDLGVLLRHERRPREARESLRRALDLAERCGAGPLADRAAEELAAAGARPRRRAITGANSLTATERRVASLAAQGKSNPEIAQSLFVTRKTVEKHLGNAYLKLQISSRVELAAALSAEG